MNTLLEQIKENLSKPEAVKAMRSGELVLKLLQNNDRVNTELVNELKKYYSGLTADQLTMLWNENYHSIVIGNGNREDNEVSYLVRCKMIAISTVLNEKH